MVALLEQRVTMTPLLTTKLYVPRWRSGMVSRPRLTGRLDFGARRTLAIISAPAGFGKSTLLAEWLAMTPSRARSCAWVSLDGGDNDPVVFWTYVIAALQSVRSGCGAEALARLHAPESPPIEAMLTTLLNEISAIGDEILLALDDFHVIEASAIHSAVAFLLDRMPPHLHLVIASRSDPPLPLARLRGRGEVIELRAADLRFTPDEAAAFLNRVMSLDLSASDVAALDARTEGWIAGLQLAALSMHGRGDVSEFITTFAGDDRYIVDYLVEEVLARQPDHIRQFLLDTSLLDRLNGSLCDAVTGRDDGKETLEFLERANLFVVPLDDKRRWYRYHRLFADVLRAHEVDEHPERIPLLYHRAGAWFEERGMAVEAIEQACAAGEHATVARLLAAHFEEFERSGQFVSVARWAATLPPELTHHRPRLALITGICALRTDSHLGTARQRLAWAEAAIEAIERGDLDPFDDPDGAVIGPEGLDALKGETLALKLQVDRSLKPVEVAALADRALALLPSHQHRLRGLVHMISAAVQMDLSDLRSALPSVDRGVDEARRSQNPLLLSCVLEHRGEVTVALGRLEEGRRSLEEALAATRGLAEESAWTLCGPHARLADVVLEQGDLAGALAHVEKVIDLTRDAPKRSFVLYGRSIAAQVLLAAGDMDAAMEQLAAAQAFAHGVKTFRFASFLASVELTIFSRAGNLAAAAEVVRYRGLSPESAIDVANEEEMTAFARCLIARGDVDAAAHLLVRLLPILHAGGRVRHEIHALALQALAYERLGRRGPALASLGRATMLGEPGQFTYTFTGDGPVMTALVEAVLDAVQRGDRPAEAGSPAYLVRLSRAGQVTSDAPGARTAAAALPEPLTAREIEVLRLIAAGKRNQEIADRLFIGLPTVKRHIANAYGKLDVSHRTEAVARATELNLL